MQDGSFGFSGFSSPPDLFGEDAEGELVSGVRPPSLKPDAEIREQHLQALVEGRQREIPEGLRADVEARAAQRREGLIPAEDSDDRGLISRAFGAVFNMENVRNLPGDLARDAKNLPGDVASLIGRTGARVMNNVSDLVVGGGAEIVKKFLDLTGGPAGPMDENFLAWYDHRREINPLTIDEETINYHFEAPESMAGKLVEDASVLITGFLLTRKIGGSMSGTGISSIDDLAGLVKSNKLRAAITRVAQEGIAEGVFFEGDEGRLADMLNDAGSVLPEDTPAWVVDGLDRLAFDWMSTDMDDSVFESRVKNFLEGSTIGSIGEGLVGMYFAARGAAEMSALARAQQSVAQETLDPHIERVAQGVERVLEFRDNPKGTYRIDPNPDGSVDVVLREAEEAGGEFTSDAREFVQGTREAEGITADMARFADEGDEPKLFHVAGDVEAVRQQGLRSRDDVGVEGLGGGSGNTVSVTYSAARAQRIEDTMKLASRAAKDEADIDDILNFFDTEGLLDAPKIAAERLGAPRAAGESLEALEEWIFSFYKKGAEDETKSLFQLVKDLDGLRDDMGDPFRPSSATESVGFFGGREAAARMDPEKIGTVEVEARRGAKAEPIPLEEELRFLPEDVRVRTEEGPVTAAQHRMRFKDPVEAEQVAATLESLERTAREGPGLTPEDAERWVETASSVRESFKGGASSEEVIRLIDEAPINLKYVHSSHETKAGIAALAEVMDLSGTTRSRAELRKMASQIMPGADADAVIRYAESVRKGTENLDATILGLRGMLVGHTRAAQKFAAQATTLKGEARTLAMGRLAKKLEEVARLAEEVRGSKSNVGRTLESFKAKAGPRKVNETPVMATMREQQDAIDEALQKVTQAESTGDPKAIQAAQEQLSRTAEEARRIMDDELGGELEGVRQAEGVSASQLPARKPGEVSEGEAAEAALTPAEEARRLSAEIKQQLEQAKANQARTAAAEGFEAPFAPPESGFFSNMTPDEIDAMARMIFMAGNDPTEVLRQIAIPPMRDIANSPKPFLHDPKLTGFKKAARAIHWYRVNAMLSGLKTQGINMTSNMFVTVTRPVELVIGGLTTGDLATAREGVDMFAGLFGHFGDSWKMASRAFKSGESILTPHAIHTDHTLGSIRDVDGGVKGVLTNLINVPGRFLMGGDELFAQMNYRAHLRAGLLRQGRKSGLDGDQLSEFVETHLRFGFGQKGQGVMQPSVDYALTNTFKNSLGPQGQRFDEWVRNSEVMKAVLPFRRTPLNIVNYAWDRFPLLNAARKTFRDDWTGRNGLRAQQEAYGKMGMGMMVYTSAAALAFSGHLTGGGPPQGHPDRPKWLEGHKPYHLRVPGTDVEIDVKRMDPVFTPLSIIADLFEVSGELDDESYGEAALAIAMSVASTASDRSFFTTFADFMEAVTNGDGTGAMAGRFMTNFAGSFIPNILNQMNPDDVYRDARTLVDELRAKVPYLSEQVEPHRNFFGDPVQKPAGLLNRGFNPMTLSVGTEMDEVLARELYEIGAQMSMPAPVKNIGSGEVAISMDLRERGRWENVAEGRKPDQSPYDRWMELMGSAGPGGRTMRERLLRTADTDQWRDADAAAKRLIVASLVSTHREIAWEKMLAEYPSLRNELTFAQTMVDVQNATSDPKEHQRVRDEFDVDERGRWEILRNKLSASNQSFTDRNRRAAQNLLPENVGGNR